MASYTVVRRIDAGGFGVVEEVEDAEGLRWARKTFAPKNGTPEEIAKLKKRFEREVRIQSQIEHPNVMPIVDFDLEAETPWFTMPLASRSYAEKVSEDRANKTLDVDPWVDILAGVEELHRLGYVHRDIKPQNMLLLDGRWVVSDFGLILPTMRDTTVLTGSKTAYGSQSYAAPEQARDFRHTPEQADIFALGCVLHDLTEEYPVRVPFHQATSTGAYAAIIEKCTEIQPARRFQTIVALRAALFDIWKTAAFPPPAADVNAKIQHLEANPGVLSVWEDFVRYLENGSTSREDRHHGLRAVNVEMMETLHQIDPIWFERMVESICSWASGTNFDWSYSDVVGDRLMRAYQLGGTRVKVAVVLATLELSVSHNRWKVMGQAGKMLDTDADSGLVDRMIIEFRTDRRWLKKLRRIEEIIRWRRNAWHPRIGKLLNDDDEN